MSLVPNVGREKDYDRGSTRLGRGSKTGFKWENVASDAHRENYLGHSLKTSDGRNREGAAKPLWWAKSGRKSASKDKIKEEKRRLKERERRRMNESLRSGFILKPEVDEVGEKALKRRKRKAEKELNEVVKNTKLEIDREKEYGERVAWLGTGDNHRRKWH